MRKLPAITRQQWLVILVCCLLMVLISFQLPGITPFASARDYDLVILNGRVIDPESKLDSIRHIGITRGTIQAISTNTLCGRTTIDARGLVVSPGFIDLHQHGQDQENYQYKAMDGVTTALELEYGTADVDPWYAEREDKALVNYGVSVGHMPVRMNVMRESDSSANTGDAAHRAASEGEIEEMKRQIEHGLKRGAVSVGFIIGLTPGASRWEILEMFRVAARFGAPCHVHIRDGDEQEALEEVIAAAETTGASVHVVHLSSGAVGIGSARRLLEMIGKAQSRGLDVTTETYPYGASMARIESLLFDDWQSWPDSDFTKLQWVATGERLTKESFKRYRETGGWVVNHQTPPDVVDAVVASPLTMIASDGLLQNGKGHPRTCGTYSQILGQYVREMKTLTLMAALRKMTLMPAQRLERRVPAMKSKGRIRVGADADLTVFDPERVIDKATYQEAAKYSEGIKYVLVSGVLVVKDGQLQDRGAPGRPVRAPLQ